MPDDGAFEEITDKPHMLTGNIEDEGTVYTWSIQCPNHDLGIDRPCAAWEEILPRPSDDEMDAASERGDEHPGWRKVNRCWVAEWVSDSGEFAVLGSIPIPPIPVGWDNGGGMEDSQVILTPWDENK